MPHDPLTRKERAESVARRTAEEVRKRQLEPIEETEFDVFRGENVVPRPRLPGTSGAGRSSFAPPLRPTGEVFNPIGSQGKLVPIDGLEGSTIGSPDKQLMLESTLAALQTGKIPPGWFTLSEDERDFLTDMATTLEARQRAQQQAQQAQELAMFQAAMQNPFAFAAMRSLGLGGQFGGMGGQGAVGGGQGFFPTVAGTAFAPFGAELGQLGFQGGQMGRGAGGAILPSGLQTQFAGGIPTGAGLSRLSDGGRSLLDALLGFQGISPEMFQRESQMVTPGRGRPIRPSVRVGARL